MSQPESRLTSLTQQALKQPSDYWLAVADQLDWIKKPTIGLDESEAPTIYRWFSDGVINSCYNALDRHVENGRGDQTAIIYDSPVTDRKAKISYSELLASVAKCAGALKAMGVEKGDRVILYMPMVPEAAVGMLACARIGAVHSVVFGGFAPNELATRIKDAKPKAILSASCGIEPGRIVQYKPMLDEALELAPGFVEKCLILQRPENPCDLIEGRDLDWQVTVEASEPAACVPVQSTDPLYILYTSGTTGQPKGVLRDNGGHMAALKWSMSNIYDVEPGDVYWAASDVGWVVGHSYIVYAPLFHGCTTLIFEGKPVGTPDAGTFWRVIEEYKVKTLFTAPTAFRAIRREDPEAEHLKKYDISSLKSLFLAGERCDPETLFWSEEKLGVPVIDHWWQTETGWAIAANCLGLGKQAVKAGSPATAVPGFDVQILDPDGNQLPAGDMGAICIKLPLPPGCLPTLWQNTERFQSSYLSAFPGYYETGDAGYIDEDGYIYVMARTDDIINVAGHRLSTGGMEEVLATHKDVAECAVIGIADKLKGQIPMGFMVLKAGVDREEADIVKEVVTLVREKIGPVAAFKSAHVVKRLPKTRSGKILRATMRKIADGEDFKVPATIDDPVILDEIAESLQN